MTLDANQRESGDGQLLATPHRSRYAHPMAVAWSAPQRQVVVRALDEFGVDSARCERAASRILPPAREVDAAAAARRCLPVFGVYVCPRRKWLYHVNVRVSHHYVDALSSANGLEEDDYLDRHWPDRAAFSWEDLADDALEDLAGWT